MNVPNKLENKYGIEGIMPSPYGEKGKHVITEAGKEFLVFENEDDAFDSAVENQKQIVSELGKDAAKDWLIEEALYVPDGKREEVAREEAEFVSEEYGKDYDKVYNKWMRGLKDPMKFLSAQEGIYDESQVLELDWVEFDNEYVANRIVETDGIAHTLAVYDGEERRMDGYFVYRTN